MYTIYGMCITITGSMAQDVVYGGVCRNRHSARMSMSNREGL